MTTRQLVARRIVGTLALLYAFAVCGVAYASASHATDDTDGPGFVLVAWTITADAPDIWPGQTLAASVHLDDPTLDALDDEVPACGRYQVDLYVDNTITAALIAGGVLNGPGNPAEDLAYGAVEGNPYKYLTFDAPCVTAEPTQEPTPTEEPTPTQEPTVTPEPTVAPTPASSTPAAVVEVHTVATPQLAATGSGTVTGLLVAAALVAVGTLALLFRRYGRDRRS